MVSCLGSLVQSCCGEAGALERNVTGTYGERSQCSSHTGFASAWGWHLCFPHLHCSGSRLVYRERALSCMRFQFSSIPRRRRLGWACVLCLPCLSSSGSQELDWRTLPGCGAPSPLRGPCLRSRGRGLGVPCVGSGELVSSRNPPGGCQPPRISGSLWLEIGSLFAVW